MKNNTLHIELRNIQFSTQQLISNRCTSIKSARKTLAKMNKANIKRAQFTDMDGHTESLNLKIKSK